MPFATGCYETRCKSRTTGFSILFLTGTWLALRRAGPQAWRALGDFRQPLNALGLAASFGLLLFTALSTVHSVRESAANQPMRRSPSESVPH